VVMTRVLVMTSLRRIESDQSAKVITGNGRFSHRNIPKKITFSMGAIVTPQYGKSYKKRIALCPSVVENLAVRSRAKTWSTIMIQFAAVLVGAGSEIRVSKRSLPLCSPAGSVNWSAIPRREASAEVAPTALLALSSFVDPNCFCGVASCRSRLRWLWMA